jgi:arylsulfatase A-like enzyme
MRATTIFIGLLVAALVAVGAAVGFGVTRQPHNVIIFVADGLRSQVVTAEDAPALEAVREEGVDLRNSHSLYPTITTPNASVIATGHRLGDTGDFANVVWAGSPPLPAAFGGQVAALEDDAVLGDMNQRFGGDYLHETTLLEAAHAKGFSTAVVGKLGPAAIQDVTARDGRTTIVIDDNTGGQDGFPLPGPIKDAIRAAGLATTAPDRGLNTSPGDYIMRGTWVANVVQQDWFAKVASQVLLPRFKAAHKPFVMVFWSRDPDGTQHNQGDSLNTLTPGINGSTSMAAIRNASNDLQQLRDALKRLGLDKTTDIIVTADHGFSVASKQSATSAAAKLRYVDVPPGFLPRGFLAIDLSKTLGLPLHDANGLDVDLAGGFHPRHSGQLLGADVAHPQAIIAPNGGTDEIWLPGPDAKAVARRIVEALSREDYTGAIFVRDDLGPIPGALPTSAIGMKGRALPAAPAIIVSFRSFSTGCAQPEVCGAEVADTELQQGQGIHGAFGRADTHNFMAAIGPDFRRGFVDPAPVSNADIVGTVARILGLDLKPKGHEVGRVMAEALVGGVVPPFASAQRRSTPAANGFVTVLNLQTAGGAPYFDTAGAPGRTLGLKP